MLDKYGAKEFESLQVNKIGQTTKKCLAVKIDRPQDVRSSSLASLTDARSDAKKSSLASINNDLIVTGSRLAVDFVS